MAEVDRSPRSLPCLVQELLLAGGEGTGIGEQQIPSPEMQIT